MLASLPWVPATKSSRVLPAACTLFTGPSFANGCDNAFASRALAAGNGAGSANADVEERDATDTTNQNPWNAWISDFNITCSCVKALIGNDSRNRLSRKLGARDRNGIGSLRRTAEIRASCLKLSPPAGLFLKVVSFVPGFFLGPLFLCFF